MTDLFRVTLKQMFCNIDKITFNLSNHRGQKHSTKVIRYTHPVRTQTPLETLELLLKITISI